MMKKNYLVSSVIITVAEVSQQAPSNPTSLPTDNSGLRMSQSCEVICYHVASDYIVVGNPKYLDSPFFGNSVQQISNPFTLFSVVIYFYMTCNQAQERLILPNSQSSWTLCWYFSRIYMTSVFFQSMWLKQGYTTTLMRPKNCPNNR